MSTQHGPGAEAERDASAQQRWLQLSPVLDQWMERVGDPATFRIEPGSSLAGDNAVATELRMSTPAQMGTVVAVEHLHALKVLIVDARSLHPIAPFSLVRGAIESAATAYWVLSPRSRNERVMRALRWYSRDARDNHSFDLRSDPAQVERRLNRIGAVAEARGLDPGVATGGFRMTPILTEVDESADLGVKPMWQLCSGFAHGRLWSTVGALGGTDLGETDRGARAMNFTGSLYRPLAAAEAALGLLVRLDNLWTRRATSPHSLLEGQPSAAGAESTETTVS